ncbi:MAG: UDP-N-acetylmuramoyl-L-alanyl-D-glutamate--2,6-diaminopimelate ligase [Planctomycetota bacterium]|nr:UDP-N-acetylmuramoyl-L-alanyl-D-glutamate--2,6-diaminopimelate ligase [Planctomycetota bacterium]
MIRLSELVRTLGGRCQPEARAIDREIRDVHIDSRRVDKNALFAALPGRLFDGARFVPDALERGATAVLSPQLIDPAPGPMAEWSNWVHPEARRVAGEAAALAHGRPSDAMTVIGVTGTNGKSTTVHLVAQLFERCDRRPGLVGTVGYRLWGAEPEEATHTTPDATELQRLCARNRENGGDALVLEVSSHALDQERIAGLELDVAVFTNLSRDHLDYHGSMPAYAAAKERIFSHVKAGGTAAIRAGDPYGERMIKAALERKLHVVTFGHGSRCDLFASRVSAGRWGTDLYIEGMGIPRTGLTLPLVGRFNVENALAAAAAVLLTEASPSRVLEGLAAVSPPPGRLQRVDTGERGFDVFVDYAHTPEALERALGALREAFAAPTATGGAGRVLCVFGCGGERDPGKRAPMGRVASRLADVAVVTSDNPRSEDPDAIIAAILEGTKTGAAEVVAVTDRRAAIRRALELAREGDVVLIAGKGHERWQQLLGREVPFDDTKVAAEELP